MFDLHCHTYYSDGKFSPAEVVAAAAQKGIRALAISDHDNINGSLEAARYAREHEDPRMPEIVPAVEFTTYWPGAQLPVEEANVDVLGYFFNPHDEVFQAFTRAAVNDIHDRITGCCARLTEQGYPMTLQDVLAINPRYGGVVQLIQAILAKAYAGSWGDANTLAVRVWESARDTPFTIRAVIEQIHLAGGAAVLAHPTIVRPQNQQLNAPWLARLVEMGLDGIEIYHRRLDQAARAHFLALAKEFGLLVSGGSDTHGWREGLNELGSQPVTGEMVERLRERAAEHRAVYS